MVEKEGAKRWLLSKEGFTKEPLRCAGMWTWKDCPLNNGPPSVTPPTSSSLLPGTWAACHGDHTAAAATTTAAAASTVATRYLKGCPGGKSTPRSSMLWTTWVVAFTPGSWNGVLAPLAQRCWGAGPGPSLGWSRPLPAAGKAASHSTQTAAGRRPPSVAQVMVRGDESLGPRDRRRRRGASARPVQGDAVQQAARRRRS